MFGLRRFRFRSPERNRESAERRFALIQSAVRTAIVRLSEQLAKAGAKVAFASPLLPDLADSARLYMHYRSIGSVSVLYKRFLNIFGAMPQKCGSSMRLRSAISPGTVFQLSLLGVEAES